ncbi:helix-turn-helix domain-containing protein [Streptomyces aculeolatus]
MTPDPDTRGRDPELRRLGERLRATREYLGFSQQHVANVTGIPRSAVSDIERGMRKVDSLELRKFARLYALSVSYFLDETDEADAGEHALAGLPRALASLTEEDQRQVLDFARYLKFSEEARQRDEASARTSTAEG